MPNGSRSMAADNRLNIVDSVTFNGFGFTPPGTQGTYTAANAYTNLTTLNFGSTLAASTTDLSKHIALYSTTYGLNVTSSRLNKSGSGAAAGTQPAGSLWLRTDGAAGTRIYVSQGGGTWTPIAGV